MLPLGNKCTFFNPNLDTEKFPIFFFYTYLKLKSLHGHVGALYNKTQP